MFDDLIKITDGLVGVDEKNETDFRQVRTSRSGN